MDMRQLNALMAIAERGSFSGAADALDTVQSNVSTHLKKLEHEGMVTMRAEQRGQRGRKVYAITPKGRERFLRTLRKPAQPIFVYDEAQVNIYFAQHEPDGTRGVQHL